MSALEAVVLIGLLVIVGARAARNLRLSPPLAVLLLAAAVSFAPRLPPVSLPPQAVLLLFLPALLYWESLNTSLREIKANLRVIVLQAIGLVLVTAAVVAIVAHLLGVGWAMAWVLGAVLAPTDATAVASVAGGLPRRLSTTLKAESLINDGTALVIFAVAVGVAAGHRAPSGWTVAGRFTVSYVGGLAIGAAAAVVALALRRLVSGGVAQGGRRFGDEIRLGNTVGVLTPFFAYLPAEVSGVSGVVAVVTCGIVLSQAGPRRITAPARLQADGFWTLATFLLNAGLFALVGLQLMPLVAAGRKEGDLTAGLRDGVVIAVVVTVTRIAFGVAITVLIRALDRRPSQRSRRLGWRGRLVGGWSGFRGAVSLAAALSVPTTAANGDPLGDRDLLLLVTFVVITLILVVQGTSMPALIRWADFPHDDAQRDEMNLAEIAIARRGQAQIDQHAAALGVDKNVRTELHAEYDAWLRRLRANPGSDDCTANFGPSLETRLRVALIAEKRAELLQLRDDDTIDDVVLRRIQARLDTEEIRLVGRPEES